MRGDFYKQLNSDLDTARAEGLFKEERIITSAQQADITVADGSHVINFCANNYLGLANHPELIAAAKNGMDTHGFGMASVRFICGTQDSHKQLEKKLADFLGMEDAILYSSCFDANGGLFETLLGAEDAIISDALNHASIIDGVRLCKAKRFRYANNDMVELEARLKEAREAGARHVLIATDGVFSMDGVIANLKGVCDLADKYDVDADHSIDRANERVKRSVEEAFASTVEGYTTKRTEASSVRLHNGKAKYALYPVWLLNTTWNGQRYTFAMNGQTGKFVGDLPVDKSAAAKWTLGLTVGCGAVIYGICWLLRLLRIL